MKANKFYWIGLMALSVAFASCEKQEPFDTQTADDAPLILVPYETTTGTLVRTLANPDVLYVDSVVVTPSGYTTVNWYLDKELVHTGVKIEQSLLAGHYDLLIEAVTTAGKRTQRTGTVTVNPGAEDPASDEPAIGRHFVPGNELFITGKNLMKVVSMVLTRDIDSKQEVCSVEPKSASDTQLSLVLPDMADGVYYLRLKDAAGKLYGADKIHVHNASIVLAGFEEFAPQQEWVITGVCLQNVKSVTVDETVITDMMTTVETVTFMAPDAEVGEHTISMKNEDGSDVLFVTAEGTFAKVKTIVSAEYTLWSGPVALDWNADLVNITAAQMADVPLGSTILVYFEFPDAEYHNLRITTPWWGDDLVAQFDVTAETPNPFTFVYDDRCKGIVDMVGSWSIVGFGETINKITYK